MNRGPMARFAGCAALPRDLMVSTPSTPVHARPRPGVNYAQGADTGTECLLAHGPGRCLAPAQPEGGRLAALAGSDCCRPNPGGGFPRGPLALLGRLAPWSGVRLV